MSSRRLATRSEVFTVCLPIAPMVVIDEVDLNEIVVRLIKEETD